jgi:hypothetical protein
MPSGDFFNDNANKNQADIKQSPENRAKQPPKSLLTEEVMVINQQPIVFRGEAYIDRDGRLVKQLRNNYELAADGRWLMLDQFVAISWTCLPVPHDRFAVCLNPFEHHAYRVVYLGIDGDLTDLRNVLCSECLEYQARRLFWKELLLGGLIYNPTEY